MYLAHKIVAVRLLNADVHAEAEPGRCGGGWRELGGSLHPECLRVRDTVQIPDVSVPDESGLAAGKLVAAAARLPARRVTLR